MPNEPNDMDSMTTKSDVAGTAMAGVFILLAAAAMWDTTTMVDADSYVFPRAVLIAMIVFCGLLIVRNLVRPGPSGANASAGSSARRVLLVTAMLGSTALMPVVGFFIAGLGAFLAIMMVAMYDPWTPYRRIVYPLACAAIVVVFYILFTRVLLVPLPSGLLFD